MLKGLKGILEKGLQIAGPLLGNMILPGGLGSALGGGITSLLTGNKPKDALMSAGAGYLFGREPGSGKGSILNRMFTPQQQSFTHPRSPNKNNANPFFQKIMDSFKPQGTGDEKTPGFGMQALASLGPGILSYMAAKQDAKKAHVPDASEYMSSIDTMYGGQTARPPEGRRIQNLTPTFAANGGIMDIEMSDTVSYPVTGYAGGGYPRMTGSINGPGTKTSDSIPARLSDGEFVQKTDAVNGAGIMMGANNAEEARKKGADFMYALQDKLSRMGRNVA